MCLNIKRTYDQYRNIHRKLIILLQFMTDLGNPSVLNVFLKHISQLVEFYACFPKLVRLLLKVNIVLYLFWYYIYTNIDIVCGLYL